MEYDSKTKGWGKDTVGRITWSNTQSGWICPKCGRIWAPLIQECAICNLSTKKETNKIKDIQETL